MNVTICREVEAVRIPGGERVPLHEGTEVTVTQSLGGSYTVAAAGFGGLYRIDGSDADALGLENKDTSVVGDGVFSEAAIWDQLRNCFDPEIPVNIVDLGLIYDMTVRDEGSGKHVDVSMTLTAAGCGMGPTLAADAKDRILRIPGVVSADVQLVWDPPWSPDRISPEGRKTLGID